MVGHLLEKLGRRVLPRGRNARSSEHASKVKPLEQSSRDESEASAIRKPMHSDWAWRPQLWSEPIQPAAMEGVGSKTAFGDEVRVFHDCPLSEVSVSQSEASHTEILAPFSVSLTVDRFEGSFLSLAIDLPDEAISGLTKQHILALEASVQAEPHLQVFARLNVSHGPNSEKLVLALPGPDPDRVAEFDMATSQLNEARVQRAWVDLIFEGPEKTRISLADVTLTRRPRAPF